jgi:hypothetical protein
VKAKSSSSTTSLQDEIRSSSRSVPLASEDSKPNPCGVLSFRDQQALNSAGIQYSQGIVRKTWVYGCPRVGDDIRIEEVLQNDDLELAVLSAFQVDPTWLETKLNPKTKVIWVLQAKTETEVSVPFMHPSTWAKPLDFREQTSGQAPPKTMVFVSLTWTETSTVCILSYNYSPTHLIYGFVFPQPT